MPRRQKAHCVYLLYSRYYFYLKNMLIKTFLCTLIKLFLQLSYLLNQPWIFIRRTDAEAEGPILWPPDGKSQLTGKDPDVGKDWRQEEKGVTENEMAGWQHWLAGHEFEQTPGDTEGQENLGKRVGHNLASERQQFTNWTNILANPIIHILYNPII